MNSQNINLRIKWIVPLNLLEKVQHFKMCYPCFNMVKKVVISEYLEDNCKYDIVIDALSDIKSIKTSEQFLQSLDGLNLRYLTKEIKSQIRNLGLLGQFVSEIRKIYIYGIEHFPDYDMMLKFYYATIGDYKYIDRQSLIYLKEYVAHYKDDIKYDSNRALAYYLLALKEKNMESSRVIFLRKAIGLFEIEHLNDDFPCEVYACEHALCLIEWADILSARRMRLNEFVEEPPKRKPCILPYEKAIEIMKSYIKYEVSEIRRLPEERRFGGIDFVRSLGIKIDARLRESPFATKYSGILPKFCEECFDSL